MGSFNDPIDVVGDMVEELASIAVLQSSKDLTHTSFTNSHPFLQSRQHSTGALLRQGNNLLRASGCSSGTSSVTESTTGNCVSPQRSRHSASRAQSDRYQRSAHLRS